MIDSKRARERRHAGSLDARDDAPVPGKQSLTENMTGSAPTPANDRVCALVDQLERRAARLDAAIAARDFDAADEAACLVDRFRTSLRWQLDHIGDEPALRGRAAAVEARLDALMPLAPTPRGGAEIAPDDRGVRRVAWLARGGSATGTSLPAALRLKLERTMGGGDLSRVRVHTDPAAAQIAGDLDARALAVGQDIYFGAGQYDPASAGGQHLVAHEVAHTVQQRGAEIGPRLASSTSGEHEAESFASAFAAGVPAPITQSAPVSIQRFGVGDVIGVVAGPALPAAARSIGAPDVLEDAAVDALAKLVDGGDALIELLGRVPAPMARLVIKRLAEIQLDVVLEALELASKQAVIRLLLSALSDDQVRRLVVMLGQVNTAALRKLIRSIYDGDMMKGVGRAMFELPHALLKGVLHHIGGPVLARLWELMPDDVLGYVLRMVDDFWPVGMGVALGGHIGATFGYPIHVHGGYEAKASRLDRKSVALGRRGEARVAFDTGASYGVYLGTKRIGAGAQAGANFEAGAKMIVIQDYEFPVFEDPNTFLPLIFAFFMMESTTLGAIGTLLAGVPSPERYNTRTQFEVKGYVQGSAEAELGVRKSGDETQPGKLQRGDSAPDIGDRPWWAKLLGLSSSLFTKASMEAGVGCELKQDWDGVTDRSAGPKKIDLAIFAGGAASIDVIASLPFLPFVPKLPSIGGGVGAKLKYIVTRSATGDEPELAYDGMELYATNGDLEQHGESATEISVAGKELPQDIDQFLSTLDGKTFTITRRFGVGTGTGRSVVRRSKAGLRSLLPTTASPAFTLEGSITATFQMTGAEAKAIVNRVIAATDKLRQKGVGAMLSDVMTFLSSGDVAGELADDVDAIATMLAGHVRDVTLHGRAGLSVYGGARIAAGLKARLDFGVGGFLTIDKDLLDILGRLAPAEVAALLREKEAGAEQFFVDDD